MYFSLFLCLLSIGLAMYKGLNFSIDFTGGNVVQVEFKNRPDVSEVRDVVSAVVAKEAMIQDYGEKGAIIRIN